MIRVVALVEGHTERAFGQRILADHFGRHDVAFHPRLIGDPAHKGKPSQKGGKLRWEVASREISKLIRQRSFALCTTMFDLYALPEEWPGRKEARDQKMKNRNVALRIEQAMKAQIAQELQMKAEDLPFFAYLALHEFEALLFSDPKKLASVTGGTLDEQQYAKIIEDCGCCEAINDRPETAPSKHILRIAPHYKKTTDGIIAAKDIGLETMREKCPHFNDWLTRIENCGKKPK